MIDLGEEKVPIRAMTNVGNTSLWIGAKNKIFILNAADLTVTVRIVTRTLWNTGIARCSTVARDLFF